MTTERSTHDELFLSVDLITMPINWFRLLSAPSAKMSIPPSVMNNTKPSTAYEHHLISVFSDADFIEAINGLKVELSKTKDWGKMTSREKISSLWSSAEFKQKLAEIAHDFSILNGDIEYYLLDLASKGYPLGINKAFINYDANLQKIKISLDLDIKQAEFQALWKRVANMKGENYKGVITKNKPPENYALVYAIFKGLKRGETMPQLFRSYKAGKLQGYSGSKSLDQTEFNHYYKKYAPITSLS